MMRRTVLRVMAVAVFTAFTSGAQADPEDGITVPDGWSTEVTRVHNIDVVAITAPADKDAASQLIRYRFPIPVVASDLEALTTSVIEGLGVTIQGQNQALSIPGVAYRDLNVEDKGGVTLRLLAIAREHGPGQSLYLLAAVPEEFEPLGGADFMLDHLSGFASLEALREDAELRRTAIGGGSRSGVLATSKVGQDMTAHDFALLVEVLEGVTGYRLSGAEMAKLREAMIAGQEVDDTVEDNSAEIEAFMVRLRDAPPIRQVAALGTLYTEAYLSEKKGGEPTSPFMAAVQQFNPVLAEKGDTIMTARALDARLRSADLYYEWTGETVEDIDAALDFAREDVIRNWGNMPEKRRKDMMIAQQRWLAIWTVSGEWPETKRTDTAAAKTWSGDGGANIAIFLGDGLEWKVNFDLDMDAILGVSAGQMVLSTMSIETGRFNATIGGP